MDILASRPGKSAAAGLSCCGFLDPAHLSCAVGSMVGVRFGVRVSLVLLPSRKGILSITK